MFRKLFGGRSPQTKKISAEEICCGDFHLEIVGEAGYQDELRRISAGRAESQQRVEFQVVLVPEPENQYDSNAVAVYAAGGGVIGYLSRDVSGEFQPLISAFAAAKGAYPSCKGEMHGGYGGKRSIGVWLDLDTKALSSVDALE